MVKIVGVRRITGLQINILLPYSSIRKTQAILTPMLFNNHQFSTYLLYYLHNFNKKYVILITLE
jgi:hypothetical protein